MGGIKFYERAEIKDCVAYLRIVYQYKDEKESEIQTLVNEHENLKKEINKIHENYSRIIENTTKQIDDFVEKISTENSVQ